MADAVCTPVCTDLAESEPDLAAIFAAWSDLPEPIRAGILAMMEAAGQAS